MPRQGELCYYDVIGEQGREHALGKPFTNVDCGAALMQIGEVMNLLPAPPARILECGCGPGWLSYILSKHGYTVVGTDVAADAIDLARSNPVFRGFPRPEFFVADSDILPFRQEFDAVVFFDSLHHSLDEQAAINSAYRALKPGGLCITSEPGRGHSHRSTEVVDKFDVTEKDMPPSLIRKLARNAGFRRCRVYPRLDLLGRVLTMRPDPNESFKMRLLKRWPFRWFAQQILSVMKGGWGVVVLEK
jgi:SAM-dependent methyltransferase